MKIFTRKRQILILIAVLAAILGMAGAGTVVVRQQMADRVAPLLRPSDFSAVASTPGALFNGHASPIQHDELLAFRPHCDKLETLESRWASSTGNPLGGHIAGRGPEEITAMVLEHPGESGAEVRGQIEEAIRGCSAALEQRRAESVWPQRMEPLAGLRYSAIGYRWGDVDEIQAEDRAYATTPDGRLLVVSISTIWTGTTPPSGKARIQPPITLNFLLETAMPRVKEIERLGNG